MDGLRAIARAQAWQEAGPLYWDMAMFVPASVSVLWASYLAAARQARQAGSEHDARRREADAAAVRAAVMEGSATALSYLQREAGYARSGGADWSGRDSRYELGRWEDARHWVIGSFGQLISVTGGPQIHGRNLVLNLVQTERTGEWGRLGSRGLDRHRGGAAALGCRQMESALTRELGVCWIARADGTGREIAGISQAAIDLFSSYPDDEYKRPEHPVSPDSERQEPPTAEPSEDLSLRDEMKKMGWL